MSAHTYDYDLISQPDLGENHQGFIVAEEHALKFYLSGVEVPFKGQDKPVPVYYRWPSSERQIRYPFITIDLLAISPAYERWHSFYEPYKDPSHYENVITGATSERLYYPGYGIATPEEPDNKLYTGQFLPYDLMFQVNVYSRTATDDRYLMSRFFTDFFGPRSFFIYTHADGVWHRCELVEFVAADSLETIEATKRQFRKIYTIKVESEVPTSTVLELQKVRNIHVDIYDITTDERLLPNHPSDSPAHADIAEFFNEAAPEGT